MAAELFSKGSGVEKSVTHFDISPPLNHNGNSLKSKNNRASFQIDNNADKSFDDRNYEYKVEEWDHASVSTCLDFSIDSFIMLPGGADKNDTCGGADGNDQPLGTDLNLTDGSYRNHVRDCADENCHPGGTDPNNLTGDSYRNHLRLSADKSHHPGGTDPNNLTDDSYRIHLTDRPSENHHPGGTDRLDLSRGAGLGHVVDVQDMHDWSVHSGFTGLSMIARDSSRSFRTLNSSEECGRFSVESDKTFTMETFRDEKDTNKSTDSTELPDSSKGRPYCNGSNDTTITSNCENNPNHTHDKDKSDINPNSQLDHAERNLFEDNVFSYSTELNLQVLAERLEMIKNTPQRLGGNGAMTEENSNRSTRGKLASSVASKDHVINNNGKVLSKGLRDTGKQPEEEIVGSSKFVENTKGYRNIPSEKLTYSANLNKKQVKKDVRELAAERPFQERKIKTMFEKPEKLVKDFHVTENKSNDTLKIGDLDTTCSNASLCYTAHSKLSQKRASKSSDKLKSSGSSSLDATNGKSSEKSKVASKRTSKNRYKIEHESIEKVEKMKNSFSSLFSERKKKASSKRDFDLDKKKKNDNICTHDNEEDMSILCRQTLESRSSCRCSCTCKEDGCDKTKVSANYTPSTSTI